MNDLTRRIRLLPIVITLFILILIAGCGGEPGASTAERAAGNEATAEPATYLLPTPTLAGPAPTADPLRPPTPVVLPSATPDAAAAELAAIATPVAAADLLPPMTDEPETTSGEAAVALPVGATALELLALGRRATGEGDTATAAAAFGAAAEQAGSLSAREAAEARLGQAMALLDDGHAAEAAPLLEALLQDPTAATPGQSDGLVAPVVIPDAAAFHLGRARSALGDHAGAIEAYRAYAQANPDMAAYVQPLIADAYGALGDTAGVLAAMEAAIDGQAQRFVAVANRGRLASLYLERSDHAAAVAQYDAIHDIARTEATKGQMTYLAGLAEMAAGNTDAAYERYLRAVADYPRAAESYTALLALVEAGVPVDGYQRGVVDFYAGAYLPAVDALRAAIDAAPEDLAADAHLFLAWSYEGLGDLTNATAALDTFAALEPARALFERGEMLGRAGQTAGALAAYDAFLSDHADDPAAAGVYWAAATLADGAADDSTTDRYLALADAFPLDANTPAALARAAELTVAGGDPAVANGLWGRLAEQYPANEHGAAALFQLLRLAQSGDGDELNAAALADQVATLRPSNYYALRAADYANGTAPYSADGDMTLPDDPDEGRAAAETWLREQLVALDMVPPEQLGALSSALVAEPGLRIGQKLWQLDRREEAKAELETVREAYAGDAVANYQLALYFSELGLFRSSIIAAATLLNQVGATVFDAPLFLGRLSYPVHYADLILPLAERYGYDPRLQFALVRQESLFESIARSGAAAQGLSQVIPDTGAWIAQRLAWPDYENDDLYRPYVGLNFGAYYLSQQLSGFDNHVHAALAAYNAGPGNAARWYEIGGADHDRFFDAVDFAETRTYIQRIYEGFNAYRHLYGPVASD